MVFTDKTEEQKVQIWLDWMRLSSRKIKVIPPPWMEIKFTPIVEKYKGTSSKVSASDAFLLFQSFGFPIELTEELAKQDGKVVDRAGFDSEFKKHQEVSRGG